MSYFTWTDSTLSAGVAIKATHLTEAYNNYLTTQNAKTYSPSYAYSFSFTAAAAGGTIGHVEIDQVRAALVGLAAKMSNNCNCTNCCQTCEACQSCQSATCQSASCQGCQSCQTSVCQGCQSCMTVHLGGSNCATDS